MTEAKMTKERLIWGRQRTLFVQALRILCLGGLFLFLLMTEQAYAERALPAFPGAEGYGSHTPGGRGDRIIEVTNLNDANSDLDVDGYTNVEEYLNELAGDPCNL